MSLKKLAKYTAPRARGFVSESERAADGSRPVDHLQIGA